MVCIHTYLDRDQDNSFPRLALKNVNLCKSCRYTLAQAMFYVSLCPNIHLSNNVYVSS